MSPKSNPDIAAKTAKAKPQKRRGGRGLLGIITLSLLASAALRLGGETGPALAEELKTLTVDGETKEVKCEPNADIAAVLGLLREREEKVALRETSVADRTQALDIAEDQVRRNLEALSQAEQDLRRMISLSSEAAEDDLNRLTMVYENMKPKEATAVFAAMDPEFAAGFLGRMRADAAASIMAGLDPEKAYVISVLLAGRNANAPTK